MTTTTTFAAKPDINTENYSVVKSAAGGQVQCATDSPSSTMSGGGSRLRCAAACTKSVLCLDFNVVENGNTVCQLFDFVPTNYASVPGCTSFRGM